MIIWRFFMVMFIFLRTYEMQKSWGKFEYLKIITELGKEENRQDRQVNIHPRHNKGMAGWRFLC